MTLQARHALRWNRLTYEFCAKRNVLHQNIGKLAVATILTQEAKLAAHRAGLRGLEAADLAYV